MEITGIYCPLFGSCMYWEESNKIIGNYPIFEKEGSFGCKAEDDYTQGRENPCAFLLQLNMLNRLERMLGSEDSR